MVADVPVGAFLSAGVDSGVLVATMSNYAPVRVKRVRVGLEEFRGTSADEVPFAERVAANFDTQHTTRFVSREEFVQDLPEILAAMDQPSIDGINTWFASKACAEAGLKVAISGLGGDEISAGYPTFRALPNWYRKTRIAGRIPGLGAVLREILAPFLPAVGINVKAAGIVEYGGSLAGLYLLKRGLFMPWELSRLIGRELATEGIRRLDPVGNIERSGYRNTLFPGARVSVLEQSCYMRNQLLRDTDWASMAHSLEVRVPFVDPVLQRRLFRHGETVSKADIVEVNSSLPAAISRRRKSGFATPVEHWIGKDGCEAKAWKTSEHWSRNWARSINRHFGGGCEFSL
jgi:asparagine synthase (glutamine-hydrolysing)